MRKIFTLLSVLIPFLTFAQAPANDACISAQTITIPASGTICVNATNLNATSDGATNVCDNGAAGNEVWFTFIATGTTNTITVTPQGSTTNMVVSVISTGCAAGTYDACNSAVGAAATSVSRAYTVGTQVWVSVETNGVDGPFQICVTSTTPPSAPGEACATATLMCAKTDFSYSTLAGTTSSGLRPTCFGAAVQQDIWVKFTVGVTGTLEFVADPLGSAEYDWALYDITNGCPNNGTAPVSCNYNTATAVLGCNIGGAACGMSANAAAYPCPAEFNAPVTVTAGRTYAIVIDNYSRNGAGFNFSWGGTFEIAPNANFTVSPVNGCGSPLVVTLTNTSASATTHAWNFGDGTTFTGANPGTHTYTAPGNYLISLITTGGGCTDIATQEVSLSIPNVSITPSSTKVCPGGSTTLTANASPFPATYSLTFSNTADFAVANGGTVNSPITASGLNPLITAGTIASVCFDISHTNDADLDVSLVSPGGTVIDLTSDNGGTGNDYTNTCFVTGGTAIAGLGAAAAPFAGNYSPEQPFSTLNGGPANGTWQLRVTDDAGTAGGGTLLNWSIKFNVTNSIVSYTWAPTGGTTGAGPTSTNTVTPASTTTYSVVATDFKGCTNSAKAVVRVKAPAAPTVNGVTICSGNTATLNASAPSTGANSVGPNAVFNWFNVSAGGSSIYSGASYTTPALTATTTYYVETSDSSCISTTRTPVVVTVTPNPVAPTVSGATICSGNTVTLNATAPGGTYEWFTVSSGGSAVNTGASYTTPALTATTTYYVQTTVSGCTGPRTPVVVTVNPIPAAPAANGVTICSGNFATLNATAPGGTYEWFSVSSGGTAISTGASYTTPILSSTTTYYVQSTIAGCTGARTPVVVTVNTTPVAPTAAGVTICSGNTATLNATAPGGTYEWFTVASGGSAIASGASFTTPTLTAGITYYVQSTITGCTGPRTPVTVTVNPVPNVTANPQTICSGQATSIALTSNVGGATFTWTATATGVSGAGAGSGSSIAQTLSTTGTVAGTVTYTITPSASGCSGTAVNVVATVNPVPNVTATPSVQTICSGQTTGIALSSSTGGVTFNWTAVASGVSGASSGTGANIAQTLSTTATAIGTVTYTVTPTAAGCPGLPVNVVITVNPLPNVTATPSAQVICSGQSTGINLTSSVSGATFSWTASAIGASGSSAGSGSSIAQTLTTSGAVAGTVTYTITPSAAGCTGTPVNVVVTVNPVPTVTATPPVQTICSGQTTGINLTSNVSGATFSWTATSNGVSGSSAGSGSSIAQTLSTTSPAAGTVTYTITPAAAGCPGIPVNVVVTVNPVPTVTATPSAQTICSGQATGINLTSNVSGASFSWTAASTGVSGSSGGSGSSIAQTLSTTGPVTGTVTYTITPSAGGCTGVPVNVIVTVNPVPTVTATPPVQTICSGQTTGISLTSNVSGATFSWTASSSGVSGSGAGSGSSIAQTLATTGPATGTVTYTITPLAAGCPGSPINVIVTVNPVPDVTATPTAQTICSGETTAISLSSSVATAVFNWTASANGVSGASAGSGSSIAQTLSTTGIVSGTVTYTITPSANGCPGTPVTVVITVNPIPAPPAVNSPVNYCQNQLASPLSATGLNLLWYTTSSGGIGSSVPPVPNTSVAGTTTYYVSQSLNGCESPRTPLIVVVNPVPPAPVAPSPAPYCQGDVIAPLTATGTGGTLKWFSDILLSNQVGTGSPFNSGTSTSASFWVVEVLNGCQGPAKKVDIIVNPADDPSFAYIPSTFCRTGSDPLPVITGLAGGTFSATPSGLVINASTGRINLSASALGSYTITYTTNGSCPRTSSKVITITSSPDAKFTYNGPYCAGGAVNPLPVFPSGASAGIFTASPVGMTVDPNTGEIDLALTAAGTYIVTNTIAAAGGCAPSVHFETVIIEVTPVVTATPDIQTICSGQTTSISLSQNVPGTITWNVLSINGSVTGAGNGSGTSIAQTLVNTSGSTGTVTYQVFPVVSASCPGVPVDVIITVNPAPAAPVVNSPVNYCQNDPATPLTATGSGLLWYTAASGGVGSSTAPTPNTSLAGTTTYYVSQTNLGCEGSRAAIVVTVNATPPAPSATSPAPYCQGDVIANLTATGTGGTLKWFSDAALTIQVGAGSSFASGASAPGTYSFWVMETKAGCVGPATKVDIVINPKDDASFGYASATFCSSGSDAIPNITGLPGGTFSSTPSGLAINPTTGVINVTGSAVGGPYAVTYTTNGACPSSSTVNITITNGFDATFSYGGPYCQDGQNPLPSFTTGSAGVFTSSPVGLVFVSSNTGEINLATSASGTYTVTNTIAASGGCAAATATWTVVINPSPAAPNATSPITYCENVVASALTASGTGLLWYTQASGGVGSSVAPTPSTASAGVLNFWVSQTVAGCEGPRKQINVIVNSAPAAPIVPSPSPYCQGDAVADLVASGSGGAFNWYSNAGLSTLVGTGTPFSTGASASGTYSFWVTETLSGCESAATKVDIVINPLDNASFSYSSGTYCKTGTNPVPVITGLAGGIFSSSPAGLVINPSTGAVNLAASSIGGPYTITYTTNGPCPQSSSTQINIVASAIAGFSYGGPYCKTAANPSPIFDPGASAGSFTSSPSGLVFVNSNTGVINLAASAPGTYTVTNTITGGGCIPVSANTTVVINNTPAAPSVTPLTYCRGTAASSLTAGGSNLLWYPSLTGGTGSSSAPVPTTATTGTTNYYVSQTVAGCEGPRATLQVTVNPLPPAPTATSPITYCRNDVATALQPTGAGLQWYTVSSGGIGVPSVTPLTTATGTTNYWVSQTLAGCEGPRTKVAVTINSSPLPAVVSPVNLCWNSAASPLTATGTALLWYTAPTGGTGSSGAPTPVTTALGTTTYYVSQTLNGCESPRASIEVDVNAPGAPTVNPAVTYCLNSSAAQLSAVGTNLKWYTVASGGTPTSVAPVPTTTVAGSVTYYVTQTSAAGCEGPMSSIVVTVNQTQSPSVTPVTYCQNDAANALTAGGSNLTWYSALTGGVIYPAAPVPGTGVSGTTTYYVTETAQGCESTPRTPLVVTVNPQPSAPAVNPAGPICENTSTSVSVTASAGITYRWFDAGTGGNLLITGSVYTTPVLAATTTYYVEAENSFGCIGPRASVVVTVNPLPAAPVVPGATVCFGNQATLVAGGGSAGTQYFWYNTATGGTAFNQLPSYTTPTLNATVTYYVESWSGAGCVSLVRTPVVVSVTPLPAAPTASSAPVCSNNNAVLTATAPANATFDWYQTLAGGVSIGSGQTYSTGVLNNNTSSALIITYYAESIANGCTSAVRTPVNVIVNPIPVAPVVDPVKQICAGDAYPPIKANAQLNGTLTWYSDAALTLPVGQGTQLNMAGVLHADRTFYVVETSPDNCTGPASPATVKVNPAPVVNVAASSLKGCSPWNVTFEAPAGNSYQWQFGDGTGSQLPSVSHSFVYSNSTQGQYTVTVTVSSQQQCKSVYTFDVTAYEQPQAIFSYQPETVTNLNPYVEFTDESKGTIDSWAWELGDGNTSSAQHPSHTYLGDGAYMVSLTVTNSQTGCFSTVQQPLSILKDFILYVPDAFTPNNDGNNDYFKAKGIGVATFEMRVFNRWGSEVFKSNSIEHGWDGKSYNSNEVSQTDVYVYQILVTDFQGKKHKYVGKINLIK